MTSHRFHLACLLLAAMLGAGGAHGQAAATGPATQPAADPGVDAESEDLWSAPRDPAVLTTAAEVRALTAEQAAAGRPVRIRGALIYVGAVPSVLFLQDATGGVCVAGPRDREIRPLLRHGAVVQVDGVTAWGGDAAYVTAAGDGPLKLQYEFQGRVLAARLATVPQLTTPALHGELLEVEGVVRSVRTERLGSAAPNATVVTLAQGGGRVEAVLLGKAGEAITPEEYVGAAVRARGVFNAATPRQMEVVGGRLLLRLARDLTVRTPAALADELPLTPIGSLAAAPLAQPRARVHGVVTLVLPGRGMFVQDSTGGVWVTAGQIGTDQEPTARAPTVQAGDALDAVGFPGRRGWSTVLTDAAWTRTGTAPMPDAPLMPADQALAPGMDARLVRVDALVLSVSRIAQHTTFALQSGGRVFLARLADAAAGPPDHVRDGSWVRVSGVCVQTPLDNAWQAAEGASPGGSSGASIDAGPDAGPDAAPGLPPRPPSFYLLLSSEKAIQAISPPGWWTLQRVLVVCGILAAVALASIAWNSHFHSCTSV
jgi:hypothetical protein